MQQTPVWNALQADKPDAAFGVIRSQLEAWGVVPTVLRAAPTGPAPLPTGFLDDLFEGVGLGGHDKAEAKLRGLFGRTTKNDQRRVVAEIFEHAMTLPEDGVGIHIVTSFLEAAARLDPALMEMAWIEQLSMSGITQHRMSAAMILWDLAITVPGIVPLDLVAKLAQPSTEDWYVFAPALGATKQLALTRKSALDIIFDLARSSKADDRDYAVAALADLARVDAALIPIEPIQRLAGDTDPSVVERAAALLVTLGDITDAERNAGYGRFGL